ncbi:hypothetical protein ACFE04_030922 [Oxalis oulophora]
MGLSGNEICGFDSGAQGVAGIDSGLCHVSEYRILQVLVEKPLCTTDLSIHTCPPVAKLIEIVKSASLGPVRIDGGNTTTYDRFPFLVKVNVWNRFNINSGGTLVVKCCHFFHSLRLFAGANPVHVMASGALDLNHKDEGEAFVPESIVRFGTRLAGRDGVQTLKAEDDQIK